MYIEMKTGNQTVAINREKIIAICPFGENNTTIVTEDGKQTIVDGKYSTIRDAITDGFCVLANPLTDTISDIAKFVDRIGFKCCPLCGSDNLNITSEDEYNKEQYPSVTVSCCECGVFLGNIVFNSEGDGYHHCLEKIAKKWNRRDG